MFIYPREAGGNGEIGKSALGNYSPGVVSRAKFTFIGFQGEDKSRAKRSFIIQFAQINIRRRA